MAIVLELDHDAGLPPRLPQHVTQGRHPLGRELGAEPAADIDVRQLLERRFPDFCRVTRKLHEIAVVHDDNLAVHGLLDIDLDPVRAIVQRSLHGSNRVLGGPAGSAAMRDNDDLVIGADVFEQPGGRQNGGARCQ